MQPVDLRAAGATVGAQRTLAAAGYPCAVPLAGPDEVDGRVLRAETLVARTRPDGREAGTWRLLADGLARQVEILRTRPDLVATAAAFACWTMWR